LQTKGFEVRDEFGVKSPVALLDAVDQAADRSGDDLKMILESDGRRNFDQTASASNFPGEAHIPEPGGTLS
jgi:hypothetical protein